jgi:hypothetical protein
MLEPGRGVRRSDPFDIYIWYRVPVYTGSGSCHCDEAFTEFTESIQETPNCCSCTVGRDL